MPWMKVLGKPRLNKTVVSVAVDTALNLARLFSLSDMAAPGSKRTFAPSRRLVNCCHQGLGLYTGGERTRACIGSDHRSCDGGRAVVATDKLFAGSIPEIYDRLLVPLIFESYARELAAQVASVEPQDVLETAAGTGVLTRAIAARLPTQARIVATDLNQPMLDRAAQRQADDSRITWRQADALALPFEDQSFDVVACQFGAMFFPDKAQGYREACRVLKRGGHFFFNVWDRISENEFADVVTEALARIFPKDP